MIAILCTVILFIMLSLNSLIFTNLSSTYALILEHDSWLRTWIWVANISQMLIILHPVIEDALFFFQIRLKSRTARCLEYTFLLLSAIYIVLDPFLWLFSLAWGIFGLEIFLSNETIRLSIDSQLDLYISYIYLMVVQICIGVVFSSLFISVFILWFTCRSQ